MGTKITGGELVQISYELILIKVSTKIANYRKQPQHFFDYSFLLQFYFKLLKLSIKYEE